MIEHRRNPIKSDFLFLISSWTLISLLHADLKTVKNVFYVYPLLRKTTKYDATILISRSHNPETFSCHPPFDWLTNCVILNHF